MSELAQAFNTWASLLRRNGDCYCEREDRCHRSLLRELLATHGAEIS